MNTNTTESVEVLIARVLASPRALLALRDEYVTQALEGDSSASRLVATLTDLLCEGTR